MRRPETFQRARTPEQVSQRRAHILDAVRALLSELPITKITLQAITERSGLAASGLLRYFDSREAILIKVMQAEVGDWLDALTLDVESQRWDPDQRERAVQLAGRIAESVVARPTMCDLFSAAAPLLATGLTVEFALDYKAGNLRALKRLAAITTDCFPDLAERTAVETAATMLSLVAGMWPHAKPGAELVHAVDYPSVSRNFRHRLTEALANQLIGTLVRAAG